MLNEQKIHNEWACKCEKTNAKLNTPGKEVYLSTYIWLLYLIIPIIGWIIFLVQLVYLSVWPVIMIYKGNGDKNEKK